jgi:hypothetical protein
MTLKSKINSVIRHPSILEDIIQGKKAEQIRDKIRSIEEEEAAGFIARLKETSSFHINPNDKVKLNKLCYVEDWKNSEVREILYEIHKLHQKGFIHRKDWEWCLGIIALRRFDKLNRKSIAIGIGSGTEPIPFYLANKIQHVYATDLYEKDNKWKRAAPSDFP